MADRRMVEVGGAELCVETFGGTGDPALLLIGGATASMDWWDDGLCERLAAGPRRVIRYDHRDTGCSTNSPAGAPDYGTDDLVADAAGVLDALGVGRAHVVGISMGGMLALRLALDHPERISSLTLIATSPAGPGGPANPDLPPMAPEPAEFFARDRPLPDWGDRAAVIDHLVEGQRPLLGAGTYDDARLRALVARVVDRTRDVEACLTNHWLLADGAPVRPQLGRITAPALVVHGTADPLFPYGHAEALAREIPGAALLPLTGMGHQMPPPGVWDTLVPALLRHTSGG